MTYIFAHGDEEATKLLGEENVPWIKMSPSWDHISVSKSDKDSYTLVYRDEPGSMLQVEADTNNITRQVLDRLIRDGHRPSKEYRSVYVSAQLPVKGETGEPLVSYYGSAHYNYNNDQIVFEPARH